MIIQPIYNVKTRTTTFVGMGEENKGWTYGKSIADCYINSKGVDVYHKDGRFLLVGVTANSVKVTGVIRFSSRSELDLFLESYDDFDGRIQASGLSELFDTISVN